MGILDRFEKGLENVVNGAFAKAFRSQVEPVELGGRARREADNKAAVVSRGRTLTANHYTIELSPADFERLSGIETEPRADLRQVIGDHAIEQAYSFVGPVSVDFVEADDLDTGMYRVVSSTRAPDGSPGRATGQPRRLRPGLALAQHRRTRTELRPAPRRPAAPHSRAGTLLDADPPGRSGPVADHRGECDDRRADLSAAPGANVFGRSSNSSDFVIDDPGVSRRHFEIVVEGDHAVANDLGSTNGTPLHGRKLTSANLTNGDVLTAGDAEVRYTEQDSL